MLDEVLLDNLDHIVRATTDSAEGAEKIREVFKRVVAVKALIDELLLDDFPELVVLKVHGRGALNHHLERLDSVAVESRHLLFDHRNNNVPEVGCLFELLKSDVAEAIGDLLRGQDILTVALVAVNDVGRVPGVHKQDVDLVEGHSNVIIEVVITARVDGSESNRCKHGESLLHHGLHEAKSRLLDELSATPVDKIEIR